MNYVQTLKRMKKLALMSVFADKAKSERIKIIDKLDLPDHKTKNFASFLDSLGLGGKKVLVLDEGKGDAPYRASKNIPGVKVSRACLANAYDILNAEFLVISMSGLKELEEVYG